MTESASISHSPEPWRVTGDCPKGIAIMSPPTEADPFGLVVAIAVVPRDYPIDEQTRADARRIVAAVNFCKGIPTETLEQGAIRYAVDVLLAVFPGPEAKGATPP